MYNYRKEFDNLTDSEKIKRLLHVGACYLSYLRVPDGEQKVIEDCTEYWDEFCNYAKDVKES